MKLKKQNILKTAFASLIMVILLPLPLQAEEESKAVAVLPFNNTNNAETYDYLNESIPEAVITSIAGLKRFKLIDRDAIRGAMEKKKLQSLGLTEKAAKEITKILSADIYITGSFMAMKNDIQINARIFNSDTGEIIGAAKVKGKLDSTLFDTIDQLATKLAENLDKAVPRDRVVTVTQYIGGQSGFSIHAGGTFFLPQINMEKFDPAFGAALEVGKSNLFFDGLYFGLAAGLNSFSSEDKNINSLSLMPVLFVVGYDIVPLRGYKPFLIRPYLAGGMDFGTYSGQVSGSTNYRLPNAAGGLKIMHHILYGIYGTIDARYHAEFDSKIHTFIGFSAGLSYQL
jgi:TolB-like protein